MGRSLTNTNVLVGIPTPAPAPARAPAPSRGCLEDRVALLEDQNAELISANQELRTQMSVLMEWALALVAT